jgi:hypothetical protein
MEEFKLTVGGWVLLIGSLSFVWTLAAWCYYKVLSGPRDSDG